MTYEPAHDAPHVRSLAHRLPNAPRPWMGRPELEERLTARLEERLLVIQGPAHVGKTSVVCHVLLTHRVDAVYIDARQTAPRDWWRFVLRAMHERAGTTPLWNHIEGRAEVWLAHAIDMADRMSLHVVLDHLEALPGPLRDAAHEFLRVYPRASRWWSVMRGPAVALGPNTVALPAPSDATLSAWLEHMELDAPEVWLRKTLAKAQGSWESVHKALRALMAQRWLDSLPASELEALLLVRDTPRMSIDHEEALLSLSRAGIIERHEGQWRLADGIDAQLSHVPAKASHPGTFLARMEHHEDPRAPLSLLHHLLETKASTRAQALLERQGQRLYEAGWAPELAEMLERHGPASLDVWRIRAAAACLDPSSDHSPRPPRQDSPEAWTEWARFELMRGASDLAREAALRAKTLGAGEHIDVLILQSCVAQHDWDAALDALEGRINPWYEALRALIWCWRGDKERARRESLAVYDALSSSESPQTLERYCAHIECARVLHLIGEIRAARQMLDARGAPPTDFELHEPYREDAVQFLQALVDSEGLHASSQRSCQELMERVAPASAAAIHVRNLQIFDALARREPPDTIERLIEEQRKALEWTPSRSFTLQLERWAFLLEVERETWYRARLPHLEDAPLQNIALRRMRAEQRWRCAEEEREDTTGPRLEALRELDSGGPGHALERLRASIGEARGRDHHGQEVRGLDLLWEVELAHGDLGSARGTLMRLMHWEASGVERAQERQLLAWLETPPTLETLFAHRGPWMRYVELLLGSRIPDRLERGALRSLQARWGWSVRQGEEVPEFWVDPRARVLLIPGVAGPLTWRASNRSFACLIALLRAPSGVCSKEELLSTVWGIEEHHPLEHENRLRMAMFKLRKRLEDAGGRPEAWILTTEDGYQVAHGAWIEPWSAQSRDKDHRSE